MRTVLPLALAALLWSASAPATTLTYDEAAKVAARENKPLLVDFYAVWCGPCKAFAAAVESDADVQKSLSDVVLCKVDAEKEGVALAKAQSVQGYPTFVLMRPDGATYARWMGYEKSYFQEKLSGGLADLTTMEEKRARFEKTPTADAALSFAGYHESRGEYDKAVQFVDRAAALDAGRDVAVTRFDYLASGFVRNGLFSLEEVRKAADAVATKASPSTDDILDVVYQMKSVGQKVKDPSVVAPYLKPALAATAAGDDPGLAREHRILEIDHALYVSGDKAEAVRLKRASMPEGWMTDPGALNAFAWWCFENATNLDEAETLARKGIELAPAGDDRAAILDTAAEICNARGNCDDAVELERRAAAEAPGREFYKKQITRFEEIRASRAN